jgi:protein TonB
MTAQQILKADLLDLLFENRNKEYGAYVLRRDYPSHLKKALGLMLLLILALFLYAFTRPSKPVRKEVMFHFKEDHTLENVDQKPKEKKPEQRTVKAQSPTKPDYVPKIVDNPDPAKQVPDRSDTTIYNPGPQTTPGTGGNNEYVAGKVDPTPNITPVVEPTPPAEPAILENAEIDPEFPGGKEAWMNYLQRMLRVPDDMEEGERKTVRVKFVVNADGEVTDAVIIQSAGTSFDKEVLRVINRMPKWKPGKQRGRPVAVYFTQPVTFTAHSE